MTRRYVSFLTRELPDGRLRAEAIREFPSEAEAKADATQRLLMFGHAAWGSVDGEIGDELVVDLRGRP